MIEDMTYLKPYAEALGIFTVSLLLLTVMYAVVGMVQHKAYGVGWLQYKGVILMLVGVLYIIVGLGLRLMR